jgi:hypothetical protein
MGGELKSAGHGVPIVEGSGDTEETSSSEESDSHLSSDDGQRRVSRPSHQLPRRTYESC